ncbi:hypothetical protein ACOMHN_014062 [Nucella lapillus]
MNSNTARPQPAFPSVTPRPGRFSAPVGPGAAGRCVRFAAGHWTVSRTPGVSGIKLALPHLVAPFHVLAMYVWAMEAVAT